MLRRKLIRDLWRQRWQVLAVVMVAILGTAIFIASYQGYVNLSDSYRDVQVRTRLAEMTLDVATVSAEQAAAVSRLPGVAAVETHVIVELPVLLSDGMSADRERGPVRADGRLISIPLGRQPALNQVVTVAGRYPVAPTEVLVERHFAEYHDLQPGSLIQVESPAGSHNFTVSGVGVSAEYLWVARNRQDYLPSHAEFGVFFVPRAALADIGRAVTAAARLQLPTQSALSAAPLLPRLQALQVAAAPGAGNRLLYSVAPGEDAARLLADVRSHLDAGAVLAATPRAKLIGVELLQMDVDGLREMAGAIPVLFLTVVIFVVAAMMNRQVTRERPLIGMLLALGVSSGAVLRHYLGYGLVIGLVGTVPGAVLGPFLGGLFTEAYARELMLPFVVSRLHWPVLATGVGLGLAATLAACALPALRAARLRPADAMRPGVSTERPRLLLRGKIWSRTPLWIRATLRNVTRHIGRSTGTGLAVAAALVLVVATGGSLDAMMRGMDVLFTEAFRYTLRADLVLPRPLGELEQLVRDLPGVRVAEASITLPVQVQPVGGSPTYESLVQGLTPSSQLIRVLNTAGADLRPAAGEAVLSSGVARQIGVAVGDRVTLRLLPNGPTLAARVSHLSDSLLGGVVTLPYADAAAGWGLADHANTVVLTVEPGERKAIRSRLQALPGIAQVSDLAAMKAEVDRLMGLGYVFMGFMFLAGGVLAGAILFNTATLGILEREREAATLRALGMPMRGVAGLITAENGLLAVGGLALGLPLSYGTLQYFLSLYDSDLFSLPLYIHPRTIAMAVIGTVLVLLAAQWPALRHLARMNLAESTKARE